MKISIKPFDKLGIHELYSILQLRSEVFVVEQSCIYNDLDDLDQQAYHLILTKGSRIAGTARILPGGSRFPQVSIGRVVVSPHFRRQNLGKLVMQEAMKFAYTHFEASEIKISAQLYLERFYEDLGFKRITEVYDEDGIPHIGMLAK
ncbi:MAG TPA: GNAT family N-acetyltransferase [Prolixibacteraceae bacterium]|nr:GNAT family N-acetyltransferase [Prolixibacteraceae bacterium]